MDNFFDMNHSDDDRMDVEDCDESCDEQPNDIPLSSICTIGGRGGFYLTPPHWLQKRCQLLRYYKTTELSSYQIIGMAILSQHESPSSMDEIEEWIDDNVIYPLPSAMPGTWFTGAPDELEKLFAPFTCTGFHGDYAILPGYEYNLFHPVETDTAFPFLKLPAELRQMILRLALTFPTDKCGWHVGTGYPTPRHVFSGTMAGRYVRRADPNQMMSILSTNRQVYEESLGIFYMMNHLYFDSVSVFYSFLIGIGKSRRAYINSISLRYCNYASGQYTKDAKYAKRTFGMMKQDMGKLRYLHINIHEDEIMARQKRIKGPQKFPGFSTLVKVRGLKQATFEGEYFQTEQYLCDLTKPTSTYHSSDVSKNNKRKKSAQPVLKRVLPNTEMNV